ncbi:unnamed protein product [Closterium sp. NIES-54]
MVDGRDHPVATNNRDKGEASVDVFQVHVYASHSSTLFALRSHIAALDEHSAPPIAAEFLEELQRVKKHLNRNSSSSPSSPSSSSPTSSPSSSSPSPSSSLSSSEDQTVAPSLPPPLAALLPKALSAKSSSVKGTFAQAFNAVGYVRNALISSHLPFEPGRADSRKNSFTTRFATVTFTKEVAMRVPVGSASSPSSFLFLYSPLFLPPYPLFPHPPLSSAIGCRTILDPPLPQTALGEYMSMLPLKQEVSEKLPFWDVATSISAHAESALQRQQQFTDMPVLELLFSTAMKMPSLSPDHSLRTCFITAGMLAPLKVNWQISKPDAEAGVEARAEATHLTGMGSEPIQLEQVLGPVVSAHGVGPAIAIPDTLSDGVLRLSFVFVTPLFTRERMATFATLTRDFMLEATN